MITPAPDTPRTWGRKSYVCTFSPFRPAGAAQAHLHESHETAVYFADGETVTLYGEHIENCIRSSAGHCLYSCRSATSADQSERQTGIRCDRAHGPEGAGKRCSAAGPRAIRREPSKEEIKKESAWARDPTSMILDGQPTAAQKTCGVAPYVELIGMVGARGFVPPTPSPPDWCADQVVLRSVPDVRQCHEDRNSGLTATVAIVRVG